MFMKYYVIYISENPECEPASYKLLCIVEKKEVAQDFCKKHFGCYCEEVLIGE